ncbi:hypothetical protein [Brevifollis gellanilyticus]|uniref:Uncharacterized protein n=1 Tax=Brevifollis gellanilyticus TaxID=748831 RepID=A0A512MFZ8_9BACT|nr:hypothetical protein [Brevifollis gellanilyticus]GEP45664.1 hypothetical protein BGE01nite_49550 [Brevifollis gellanilyticus]
MILRPLLFLCIATAALAADAPEEAVQKAHDELWRRFVDEHHLILDYVGLKGEIVRPTPEDCREMKPSALSWGVPNEDGPMFNGLYLDALCSRWTITKSEEDRAKARRMIEGLIKVSTIGKTPGFIARGIATDGKTTYSMGSNDQTTPWLYGIWRYIKDGLARDEAEKKDLIARFIAQITVLDANGWKMPADGPPSKYRGDLNKPTWEGAPRLLFVMKAMHAFTGDESWQKRYVDAANEKVGKSQRPRIDFCREGMVFDPGQGPRHSWTGSEGVICLRALWEMETDAALKAVYAEGLRHSAELSAKSLGLISEFDVNGTEVFNVDWRMMNAAWKPQTSELESVQVALAGLKLQHAASPRMHIEKDYLREPCFAAWVVTLCPDREYVMSQRTAIEKVITHYDVSRVYLSQFFPLESAWWRIKLLENE